MRRVALWALAIGLSAAAAGPRPMSAQEPPRVSGVQLPPAYHDRIQRQPAVFQVQDGWIARAARAAARGQAVSDTLRLAVILALFADSPDPHFGAEEVQRVLFDGPSAYGTVTEFYSEVSGGRFALHGQVFPWVRTGLTMLETVGQSAGLGEDARTGDYLDEALRSVDASVDFGQFDNDGPDGIPNSGDDDGRVDAVAFQFLEVAASCGGPSIWPHRSRLEYWIGSPFVTDDRRPGGDAIVVNDYIVQSSVDCGGVEPQKATTIAHEMGHILGLPDLYDASLGILPEQRRWVVGCWSLMAAGAWGCGANDRDSWVRPTHLGAWEKAQLGWLAGIEEASGVFGQQYTLEPVLAGERVLRIPLEAGAADTSEYLLIEYRTKQGFDSDLPAAGVLVYHIDPQIPGNRPCSSCPQVYRVALVEGDGNGSLTRTFPQGGNRGEAGDAWGITGPQQLANGTTPSTRLNSGARSPVTIYEIAVRDGMAHLTLSSAAIALDRLSQPFLATGAAPLTAEERAYLDRFGNANGQYDVGDLRAYLKR